MAGLLATILAANAAAQMPDARSMSGIPRPVDDLPVGAVSVRVVRGDLGNVVPNIPVELLVAGRTQVVRTDAEGRAEFKGIAPGSTVRASTTLDGERLVSEEFPVPSQGGVRLLLSGVAPGGSSAAAPGTAPAAPAEPVAGSVVLGGESRIVIEFADDDLEVFYLLDILNANQAPVTTEPLVFDMPPEAQGTTVLEGSSPQAVAQGRRVTVTGPFAPGRTLVQIAYSIPPASGSLRIAQRFPAALAQVALIVQKVGAMTVMSPAVREQRETLNQGRPFIMGSGPGLAAGETVTIDLAGLPHVSRWPRNVALGIGVLILAMGGWAAARAGASGASAARERLEARRGQLLGQVQALDGQARAGTIDPARHAAGRNALLVELERIYGMLDTGGSPGDTMRHSG